MKRTSFALLCLIGLVALPACQKEEAKPEQGKKAKVAIAAKLPATSSIAQGTKCGLYISDPINENNVTMTAGADGNLTLDKDIYWGESQTEESSFLAYCPYNSNYSKPAVKTFTAFSDQSSEANFNASDLLLGKCSAKPSDSAVALSLGHKMSRIDLYFDNQSGKEISKVEVKGVKNQVTFDLNPTSSTAEVSTAGTTTNIQACKTEISGKTVYCVIIAPQTVKLTAAVTLEGGRTFTSSLESEDVFESGMTYSTKNEPIVIKDTKVNMTFSISDWEDGGDLVFNRKHTEKFTDIQVDGVYDIKSLDSASALFAADDNTQSAIKSERSKTSFRLIHPYEGKMVSAQFSTKSFSVGSSYNASITVFGDCGASSGSRSVKCLQKDDNRVWFQDATNNTGYIFSTRQL